MYFITQPQNLVEFGKKSRIREAPNFSTDADSSTNILVSDGVSPGQLLGGNFEKFKKKFQIFSFFLNIFLNFFNFYFFLVASSASSSLKTL